MRVTLFWGGGGGTHIADSEIGMVDRAFGEDFFKRNRSGDDFGTIISGIAPTKIV